MITGIGTDIVDIRRIEKLLEKSGEKFEQRIFSDAERKSAAKIENKDKKVAFYAKRFAAKEAYSKALGTGIGESVSFKDISIEKEDTGKPVVIVSGEKPKNIHISLSDEHPYAQAFVVIED